MDKKRIKQMLTDKELTVKGAITLYLEHGPAGRKEVMEYLGVSERSFYSVIQEHRANLKTQTAPKTTQYSLEK